MAEKTESVVTPKSQRTKSRLGTYLLTRFFLIIPTVFILVTMVFFLMRLTGDPITASVGGRLPPDELAQRIHEAGYDRPIIVQYVAFLGQVFQGDLGRTTSDNRTITELLATHGTATLELCVYALIIAFIVGIPLGRIAARYRDKWPDAIMRVLAIMFYATPVFFAGLLLKLVFSVQLNLLPISGRATITTRSVLQRIDGYSGILLIDALRTGRWDLISDVLAHAVLPAIALGLLTAGVFLRLVRTNLIGTLSQGYIDAARSRGVAEKRLVKTHAWRPALIPIITVMGMQIALMLGGAVLTETTFEWHGLGFAMQQYLQNRDFVAVQGIVILLSIIVAVTNFIVDVVAAFIDPRVRY
ncbi:MAG: ABC transporter permease [Actinomycetaceae bacterium]|nr:ABC transporter permease [Actinomycetaceae bacterium]